MPTASAIAGRFRTMEPRQITKGIGLPILVVVGLVVFFAIGSEAFLTLRNMSAISGQASVLLIACLGATLVVLMGSIDLSVGAVVLLVGSVTVLLINQFHLGVSGLLVGTIIGTGLGVLNGLVYAYGKIPSFVVTLGTMSIFTGLAWDMLEGRALRFDSIVFENMAIGQAIPYLPNIALWAVAAWVVMVFVCFKTRLGRYMFIIGGGEAVARTSGIPVRRYKVYSFALSGCMAGLCGALAVARLGAAGPTLGTDLLLNSLAAIVVGGTSLSGGVGGVHRTLIGVTIIALLDNGLNLMDVNQYTQMMIKGAVVVAAVLVGQDRSKSTVMK